MILDLCPNISDEGLEGMTVHQVLYNLMVLRGLVVRCPEKLMDDFEFIKEASRELNWIAFKLMTYGHEAQNLETLVTKGKI